MPSQFYDNYIQRQIDSGINNRIYSLYKRLIDVGLRKDSKILEIGCGIGILTYLLSKHIKSGIIEAVDFSEKSIEYAKRHISNKNIQLTASDILDYTSKTTFDYVLLFDALEHIPQERHPELFSKISHWMHLDSVLFINLPNPDYILYDQQNNPEALQEIDQPIYIDTLSHVLKGCELHIVKMETYSIWVKNDYQFYVIQKRRVFEEILLEKNWNIITKIMNRLNLKIRKIKYNYPR